MKKSFKVFILVLLIGIISLASACGKKADTSKTIIFYHTMGQTLTDVLKSAKEKFAAKFPGWTVEDTQVGGYDDVKSAIISDLQGQTQPNLAYCYADHVAQYLTTQKVVDMSKYINSEEKITTIVTEYEMDGDGYKLDENNNKIVKGTKEVQEMVGYTAEEVADFVTGYYNEGYATNFADYDKYGYSATSILTIPFVKSTELLYYNKTALESVGKTEAPKTWDELWEDAALLKRKYGDTCVPVGYDSEANWFITMCEQNGWGYTTATGDATQHYLFNDMKSEAWLTQLATYFDQGLVTTQNVSGAYTSNLFVKGAEEGSVFSIGSSGGASHQLPADGLFEWAVAPIPGSKVGDTVVNKAISQGPSLCMFYENCDNSDEKAKMTWEFVKCMLEPEFLASFSIASGYNPPRKSTFDIPAYQTFLNGKSITAVAAKTASTMVNDYFTSPAFVGSSTARDQAGLIIQYALTGEKTPEKALKDAYKNCGGH